MKKRYKKYKLKNGLTVIECYYPNFSSVYFDVAFRAGPLYEDISNHGLSHLTEHLIAKTIEKKILGRDWVKNYIDDEFRAYTTADRVNFEFNVHKEDIASGIEIIEHIFKYARTGFGKDDFEKEKEIVVEEILEEKSDKFYHHVAQKVLYGHNRFHFHGLGKKNKIKQLKQKDQAIFAKKVFCPANAVVTLAGNIKINRSVIYRLESLPPRQQPPPTIFKPKDLNAAGKSFLFDRSWKQNQLGLYRMIKQKKPADNIKWSFVVGDVLSPYLFYRLKDKFSTYSFGVNLDFYGGFLLFCIESSFQPHKNLYFLNGLKKELAVFKKVFTAADLKKIKNNKIKNLEMDAEYPRQYSNMVAWYALQYGVDNIFTIDDQIKIIKNITYKDIKLYFDKLFNDNNFTLILAGKIGATEKKQIKRMFYNKVSSHPVSIS